MDNSQSPKRTPYALLLPLALPLACSTTPDHDPEPESAADATPRSYASDSLELHWSMQDRTGTTVHDLSGHGRDGTIHGATVVASDWGEALHFDGINDYVSFTGPRDPADFGGAAGGTATISARVRVTDADRYNALCVGCAPISLLSVGTANFGNRAYAALYNQSTGTKTWPMSTNGSLADNTWVTVTMVVEAGVGTSYYVDCQLDNFVPNANVGLHDYGYSSVGEGFNPTSWFEGDIDDLRVWSRAFSASEVGAAVCDEPVELPCNGAPEAASLGIVLPDAPTSYTVPACSSPDVTCVTPATIDAQFDTTTPTIVFEDGVYAATDITGDFLAIEGQTLIARNVGGAIVQFGIDAGGTNNALRDFSGSQIQGLVFDIDDSSLVAQPPNTGSAAGRSAIRAWGDATGLEIRDVVVHGNGELDTGIYVTSVDGLVAHRLELRDLRRYGMLVQGPGIVTTPVDIEHVLVENVAEADVVADPTAATTGVGIVLSERGTISHARIRDIEHAGITINGDSNLTRVDHVDIDRISVGQTVSGVGVYLDNTAISTVVEHFCVGPDTRIAVNSEWDNCSVSQAPCTRTAEIFPRTYKNLVRDGLSEAWLLGVNFDQGTLSGNVHDVVFRNYDTAAIVFHNNAEEATWPIYDDASSEQSNNTFEIPQVNGSVCDLTYDHWNDATPQCAP